MTTTRTVRRKATVTVEVDVVIDVTIEDDPGVWRTKNGDGWPGTSDVVNVTWEYAAGDAARTAAVAEAVDAWMDDEFEDDN